MEDGRVEAWGKQEFTWPLVRPRRRSEDNIKLDIKIMCEDVDWTEVVWLVSSGGILW